MAIDVATTLRRAVALQHQGELASAELLYHAVLDSGVRSPDALHLLGLAALQRGSIDEAIRWIGEAIAVAPQHPQFHSNLGVALRAAGQFEEALRSYDKALALQPDFAGALNNRGIALEQLGRHTEAVASYDKAIVHQPKNAEALYNRGNALRALRRFAEALLSYDQAIELRPDYAEACNNRGDLLLEQERYEEALASLDQAIATRPEYAEAYYNRGNALQGLNRLEAALVSYNRAIALRPDYAAALVNCGTVLQTLNRGEEAIACDERAIALRPDRPEPWNNRGSALYALNRYDEAQASFDRALELSPLYPDARVNRGLVRLASGDFERGWVDYEWRFRAPRLRKWARGFRQKLWQGEPVAAGKTILLYAEQGLGDTLQFCRYVPLVAAQAEVVLEVQVPLARLLATLDPRISIVSKGQKLPAFDLQCPLLSLPHAFGTTLATIPAAVPYLQADAVQTEAWRRRLAELPGLKVGLVWAGSSRLFDPMGDAVDRRRSLLLEQFAPLAAVHGISLVSLQKGHHASQALTPPAGMVMRDWTEELTDFADTAALVAALDLVITVDTAVAHLAGALGRPVWILNRFDACWRWLNGREDSPWYPSARLFHQPAPGDWDSVLASVCSALRAHIGVAAAC